MDFHHCLSPYCFNDQVNSSCMDFFKKGPWVIFAQTEIGGGAFFALLSKGIKNWCVSTSSTGTHFFERCCHSPEGFHRINAAWSPWTWEAFITVYSSASRRFLLYPPSSRSRRFNFLHRSTSNFIRMGRRFSYKWTDFNSNFGWVYFWSVSWLVARNFP